MLNANERQEIDDDISNWTCEMQFREKDLDEGKTILTNEPQPEIRQMKTNTTKVYQYNNQSTEIHILLKCLKCLLQLCEAGILKCEFCQNSHLGVSASQSCFLL